MTGEKLVKRVRVDIHHHKSTDAQTQEERSKPCPRCGGTGKVHNPNSIFDMTCPTCKGKGWNIIE